MKSAGALIALFDRAVGFYATLVNINAYNQPGVEAGKKAAETLLNLQRKILTVLKDSDQPLKLAAKADSGEQIEHVYKIVRHLAANHRGVVLHGHQTKPGELEVSYIKM